jgi:hydroxypyruvate isomerase
VTGYQLSPNIEVLFTEAGDDSADRIRAAAAAGFDAVEMWSTLNKDIGSLSAALGDTGVSLTSVLAQPFADLAFPGVDLTAFWEGFEETIESAQALQCPRIVVSSGIGFPGAKRTANLDKLAEVLSEAVARSAGSGVTLILEPVNTRVDHPGVLTDHTIDAVYVVQKVDSSSLRILYDLYHSVTQGEDPEQELAAAAGLIEYVQIADAPGRGEPGTGMIDWPATLRLLRSAGYSGPIGLEYMPTTETVASLESIRRVAASA